MGVTIFLCGVMEKACKNRRERRSCFFVVQVTHIQHILIVTYNIGHWYPMHHWLWDRLSSSHGTDVVICLEQDSSTNKQMFQRTEPSTRCTGATLGWRNGGADGLYWHRNRLTSGPSGLATSSHQRKAQGSSTQSVTAQSCTHAASTLTGTFQGHRRNISMWQICASSVMPCSTPAFLHAMIHVQIRHKNRQLADY